MRDPAGGAPAKMTPPKPGPRTRPKAGRLSFSPPAAAPGKDREDAAMVSEAAGFMEVEARNEPEVAHV